MIGFSSFVASVVVQNKLNFDRDVTSNLSSMHYIILISTTETTILQLIDFFP